MVASTHGGFFHTGYAALFKKVWFKTVTRISASGYQRIIGSSENDYRQFCRIAPGRTITIENGVDIQKFRDAGSASAQSTMLFIGRFSVNKQIPKLIALIKALGSPWRLLIAGVGSDLAAKDLRVLAESLGVADRIEIFEGASDAQIRELCGRASYIASASNFEGFGLSIIEGLSAGLTPVMNNIPPFRRLYEENGCGICDDFSVVTKIAEQVHNFHSEAASRYSALREANMAASLPYGWPSVANSFAEVYREAIGANIDKRSRLGKSEVGEACLKD